jgi:uncharacterized membrane protein YdcZ (DUF606 family)
MRPGDLIWQDGHMDLFNRILIFLHVAGGLVALLIAPLAMGARKGGEWHRRWGTIYYRTMLWVLASAIILSFTRNFVVFLIGVTVLTAYSAFTGVRCLYQKNAPAGNPRGRWPDWLATAGAGAFAVFLTGYGLLAPHVEFTMAILCVIFGNLILRLVIQDVWRFCRPSADPKWWWYYHLDRMIGSYIGALTAFLVNQVAPHVPGGFQMFVWIGPALVFTPVIILWKSYYRRKFSPRAPAVA